jgi:nucleoside-diphosphate-sugar epimerase
MRSPVASDRTFRLFLLRILCTFAIRLCILIMTVAVSIAGDGEKKRVLVSGTTGWIAGGVAKELAQAGHSVAGIARRPTVINGVKSLQADLLSAEALSVIGKEEKFDVLLHLAGSLGWASVEQAVEINVAGTRKIVQAAIDAGCKRIVVASSVAVIGTVAPTYPPKRLPMPADERFVGSSWPYALSKGMVEDLIEMMALQPENKDIGECARSRTHAHASGG